MFKAIIYILVQFWFLFFVSSPMLFLVPPSQICFLCWEVAFLSWTFNICRNVQTLHQWLHTNSLKIQNFYMCFSEGSAFFHLVSAVCSPLGRFHAQIELPLPRLLLSLVKWDFPVSSGNEKEVLSSASLDGRTTSWLVSVLKVDRP